MPRLIALCCLMLALALGACGRKGPLYLPEEGAAAPPAAGEERERRD